MVAHPGEKKDGKRIQRRRSPAESGLALIVLLILFSHLDEFQADAVDAISHACRRGPIVKYVTEVSVTFRAENLGTPGEKAVVLGRGDVFLVRRLPEARPARAGIVFLNRREKHGSATTAEIASLLLVSIVDAGESRLRALLP